MVLVCWALLSCRLTAASRLDDGLSSGCADQACSALLKLVKEKVGSPPARSIILHLSRDHSQQFIQYFHNLNWNGEPVYFFNFDRVLQGWPHAGGHTPAAHPEPSLPEQSASALMRQAAKNGRAFMVTFVAKEDAFDTAPRWIPAGIPVICVPDDITKKDAYTIIYTALIVSARHELPKFRWSMSVGNFNEAQFPMSSEDVGQSYGTFLFKHWELNDGHDLEAMRGHDDALKFPDGALGQGLQATGVYYFQRERIFPFETLLPHDAGPINVGTADYDDTLCPTKPLLAFHNAKVQALDISHGTEAAQKFVTKLQSDRVFFVLTNGGLNWVNIAPNLLGEGAWLRDVPVVYARVVHNAVTGLQQDDVDYVEDWKPVTFSKIQSIFDARSLTVKHWLSLGDQEGDCIKETPGRAKHGTKEVPSTIFASFKLLPLNQRADRALTIWVKEMEALSEALSKHESLVSNESEHYTFTGDRFLLPQG